MNIPEELQKLRQEVEAKIMQHMAEEPMKHTCPTCGQYVPEELRSQKAQEPLD